jgi:hypothetical protein
MPFTHTNLKDGLEDVGSVFDGPPDLEFRAATKPLGLEKCALTISVSLPGIAFRTATRTTRRRRSTWSCAGVDG